MAIELITGRAGKAHIGSEDDRAYHAYTNGEGRYILNGGTANIESANNVHIDPVEFLVDGAHVRVTGAGEDVAIENGVASYKRIDVIALHYTRTGNEDNYIESVEFAVVKGANVELGSTPQVPSMPKSGTILTGSNDVYIPVYSLLIDGLTPKNLTTLLEKYALPVAHGGTGANKAAQALDNLGAMPTAGMVVDYEYKIFNSSNDNKLPDVSAGGLTLGIVNLFVEFGRVRGTNMCLMSRIQMEAIMYGQSGVVFPEGTTIAPPGTIPPEYLSSLDQDSVDVVAVIHRDTTSQSIDRQYCIPTVLKITKDGRLQTAEGYTKFYTEAMAVRIFAGVKFLFNGDQR